MEPEDFIITKVGWITQMKSTPPLTEEYIQRVYLRFEIMIRFLQNHKFTTRIILNNGDSVNDETGIKHSDLTAEGRKFYSSSNPQLSSSASFLRLNVLSSLN